MPYEQRPQLNMALKQKMVLSTKMYQSLEVLQMSAAQLAEYLQEQLRENPLLEWDESAAATPAENIFSPVPMEEIATSQDEPLITWEESASEGTAVPPRAQMDKLGAEYDPQRLYGAAAGAESFKQMLQEQLGAMKLDTGLRNLCDYLVDCLNRRGYLEVAVEDVAEELGLSGFEVMQALYVVQSLSPTGVAARTLEECLVLQLAQTESFNHCTLLTVKQGLSLVAADDMAGLAQLLGTNKETASRCAAAVRRLNPIPSRGYDTGEQTPYALPDAVIEREGDALNIQLNYGPVRQITLSDQYANLDAQEMDADTKQYLKSKKETAQALLKALGDRAATLQKVIACVTQLQSDFFLHRGPLVPMTMADVAEELELHTSTVSRAVQDKYIVCPLGTLPLKSLFTTGVKSADGGVVSNTLVRQKIEQLVAGEDVRHPLSDEDLRTALDALGIAISRRTVAKYREEMGIPASSKRRRR